MKAGFIGLGAIGRPIAEKVSAFAKTAVFDVRAEAMEPFRGHATPALSPSDVAAQADIIFGCLPTADSYRAALTESQGIYGGRTKIYVHLGTTGSELAQELEAALAPHGIAVIDAPITGGVPRAREGTLTSMVSGPRETVEAAMPMLRSYSREVVYLGARVGAAQTMKVINNLLSAANLAVAAEGLVLGAKAGLDPDTMLQVINAGTGQSNATLTKVPNHILTGGFDYGGSLAITLKDLDALMKEARSLELDVPLAKAAHAAYLAAGATGVDGLDMTTVIQPMEANAGVAVRSRRG